MIILYRSDAEKMKWERFGLCPLVWLRTAFVVHWQQRGEGIRRWMVVVTSYEVAMKDRLHLCKLQWLLLVVDEAHRLKNFECRLVRELSQYQTANRLLLTGTPLQNNLTELWSLLHFLIPEIFCDLQV